MRGKRIRRGRETVYIDACDRCDGLWFDHGEVERVRRAAPPLARTRPKSQHDLWDPAEKARERVAATDANLQWTEGDSEPSWWFQFLSGLPVEGSVRLYRFPLVTWALIATCFVMLFVEYRVGESIFERFGTIPRLFIEEGDSLTRLLVSMFLHGGIGHLLGNMYFLKVFGDNVEDRLGRLVFLAVYLASGFTADLAHIYMNPTDDIPAVGASGAISGLLGAYLVLFPNSRITVAPRPWTLFRQIRVPSYLYLAVWFAWQLAASNLLEAQMVAWGAHVGGFIAGVVLGWIGRRFLPDARVAALTADLQDRSALH
jgi:membrane associated rhomboid family serine protease/Zn-finger nucleic acid-binding protein